MRSIFVLLRYLLPLVALVNFASATELQSANEDHILSRSVLRDPTRTMTVAEVAAADKGSFAPVTDIYAGGYSQDAIWMKLIVRPATHGSRLILRILPAYLNELTLFEPDLAQPGRWRTQVSGNRVPWNERPVAAVSLGFSIDPEVETTYYLRLNTISSAMLNVEAFPEIVATQREFATVSWQGIYVALLIWIVLWALQDWRLSRDRLILLFACAYTIYLFYTLAIMGYLALLLPNSSSVPEITFWLVILAVFVTLLFHHQLLMMLKPGQPARWMLHVLLAASFCMILSLLPGITTTSLKFNNLIALIAGPILFLVALMASNQTQTGLVRIKTYYGLLAVSVVTYVLPLFGISNATVWTLYGAIFNGLIFAMLFGNLLHRRSRKLFDEEARSRLKLILAEKQLEMHKEQLDEQGRFTAMLTHELKNPLAAIRLNLDILSIERGPAEDKRCQRIVRALADIDFLVERCVLSDRIEQNRQVLNVQKTNLSALLADLLANHPGSARIQISGNESPAALNTDSKLLTIAISNLLENALKYSPPGTPVALNVATDTANDGRQGTRIDVTNAPGLAGFPEPELLFTKYARGQNAANQSGSGLGLYLVKGIAEMLGGRLDYMPDNEYIRFSLWIPQPLS